MSSMALEVTEELNRKFDERYVIVSETGCWIWIGETRNGYGRMKKPRRRVDSRVYVPAHRYSYARFKSDIPKSMFVCHLCDVPSCVNPDHLWLGTHKENMMDRNKKGRASGGRFPGEASPVSKLTKDLVVEIFCSAGTLKEIAETYNLAQSHVSRIKNGKTWRHVTQNLRSSADA